LLRPYTGCKMHIPLTEVQMQPLEKIYVIVNRFALHCGKTNVTNIFLRPLTDAFATTQDNKAIANFYRFHEITHCPGHFQIVSSGVTEGGRGGDPPLGKLNAKIGPYLAYILILSILLLFSWLLFFCFFQGVFVLVVAFTISGFMLSFLNFFFWVLASDPLQLGFPPSGSNLGWRHWL